MQVEGSWATRVANVTISVQGNIKWHHAKAKMFLCPLLLLCIDVVVPHVRPSRCLFLVDHGPCTVQLVATNRNEVDRVMLWISSNLIKLIKLSRASFTGRGPKVWWQISMSSKHNVSPSITTHALLRLLLELTNDSVSSFDQILGTDYVRSLQTDQREWR